MASRFQKQTLLLYLGAFLFIGGWWFLTLSSFPITPPELSPTLPIEMGPYQQFSRNLLRDALNGDIKSILSLIDSLNQEYPYLSDEEVALAHNLAENIKPGSSKFYPQTYAAASFMLALCAPEQIISLPKGFKSRSDLFPNELTNLISYETNKYNLEILSTQKIEGAFVSNYSDPCTLHALQSQGIPVIRLCACSSIEEVTHTIHMIGEITGNHQKAELMNLLIKSCLGALNKRTSWLRSTGQMPRFLCLYENNTLKLPTKKTLTGSILSIMGVETVNSNDWCIPVDKEYIENYHPEKIIIASESKNNKDIPYHVQNSPTQHMVLAYYDILYALIN